MEIDSLENSAERQGQQRLRDRYPFVTSIRETSWKPTYRKSAPAIHLLSHMAEFTDDDYQPIQNKPMQLNQFQKLKQINQSHYFDCRKIHSNHSSSNHKPTKEITNNKSSCHLTSKQITSKIADQMRLFNQTANRAKVNTFIENGQPNCDRDKSKVVQEIKNRLKQSLTNYIRNNDKRDIETRMSQLVDQHDKKVESLLTEIDKLKETAQQTKQQFQKKVLEFELQIARLHTERDDLKHKFDQTVRELQKIKSTTNDLKQFQREYKELVEAYPDMTCSKLLKEYKNLEHVCLNRLSDMDQCLVDKFESEKRPLQTQVKSLTKENNALKQQISDMAKAIESRRLAESIDYCEIQNLLKCKNELTLLQNKILQVYISWQESKSDCEKEILEHFGCFSKQYSYIDMLTYMGFYKKELSTDHKARDFLRRTLGLIQNAKKRLFNDPLPDKTNPEKIIESIIKLVTSLRRQIKKPTIELLDSRVNLKKDRL